MAAGYREPKAIAQAAGPTLTAAAAATCLPVSAKCTFPPNAFFPGVVLFVTASGNISNAVTTPGTARLDLRLGGTVIFDTGALALNIVAKTTMAWRFTAELTCRAGGASGNFMGMGVFESEAIVGSPLATVGGSGGLLSAVAGGPDAAVAVGGNVDLTVSNAFDCFFTQTVATGSFTVQQFLLESLSMQTA